MKYLILLLLSVNAFGFEYKFCDKKQQKVTEAIIPYTNNKMIPIYGGGHGLSGVKITCPKGMVFFAADPNEITSNNEDGTPGEATDLFDDKGNVNLVYIRAFKNGKLVEVAVDTEKTFPDEYENEKQARECKECAAE